MEKQMYSDMAISGLEYSVLPMSYFDGSRVAAYEALEALFLNGGIPQKEDIIISSYEIEVVKETYYSMVEQVTKKFFMYESEIKKCFIPFCKTGKYSIRSKEVRVWFDGQDEKVLSKYLFDAFIYHKGYNTVTNLNLILHDYECEITREVEYFPVRNSTVNGQLKIAVGAVLAVDGMEKKEDVKVLIVGSGHDPMYVAKSAYSSLPHMIKGQIDMYDPLEEDGEERIGNTIVSRHRNVYDYDDVDKYDLVIDDTYSYGSTVDVSKFSNVRDFSIKSFSESPVINNYLQVSHTNAGEVLLVSRSVQPDYNDNNKLGTCTFCRELKYYLREDYPDEVFYQFYLNHPFDICRARGYYKFRQRYHEDKSFLKIGSVENIDYLLQPGDYIDHKNREIFLNGVVLRRLINDTYFFRVPVVEKRRDHLQHVYVLITSEMYLTQELLSCKGIYLYDGDDKKLIFHPTTKIKIVAVNDNDQSFSEKSRDNRNNQTLDKKMKHLEIVQDHTMKVKIDNEKRNKDSKNKGKYVKTRKK